MINAKRFKASVQVPRFWALVAGLCCGAGQAPLQLWPITLIGMGFGVTLWAWAKTPRAAAAIGWWLGFGAFLSAMTWLADPFLVDAKRHAWMIPFALGAMAGGLALFWSCAFYVAKKFRTGIFGLAAVWALAELARGFAFTGFPWALPAYIWLDTPVAQLAAYVGPYGLSAVTFGVAALYARIFIHRSLRVALWPALALAAMFGLGELRLAQPLPADSTHNLRLVQPNAAQHLKWDPAYIDLFFDRALALSDPEGVDLVIWPETSVAAPLYAAQPYLDQISERTQGVPAVVGLQRVEGYKGYNSAAVIGASGQVEQIYDKRHLVPFGEYLPLPSLLSAVGLRTFTAQQGFGFSAGEEAILFDFGPLGTALPLICYEAIFPRDTHSAIRPDWMLQITNDAWFGTRSGPQQSLAQARFRAIETGLPMVRAANTGISAVIDPYGNLRAQLPLGEAGSLISALPTALAPTWYLRLTDRFILILLSFAALSAIIAGRRRHLSETV
ncbi:apolipoprotein N-acyltransferase [Pacificibacter maritimus]|uniref:Apolipoprotein N-acyltransferase n=1 Tax=Pacificibacter maritimus TaxID=762213 RepID=A0A3N4UJ58_9RHOB|nr:apolipoprotein N-acyltransferase [Pacificibacter maritimus]RPE67371.1 apolipoprotein N-acyltransferase [Pacificibacter maritimus]